MTAPPWVAIPYTPRRIGLGRQGGPAWFFITHPDAETEELQAWACGVRDGLNRLDKEKPDWNADYLRITVDGEWP